ncbi:hypothetical protein HYH03_011257 [Edaphochlamys debaryana]|uniref:Right handed beta helix domain-containing protein n=1 Tax=Edaphochlamys debaryana TaxID=47281 RepID=A0A835XUD9_9CHLO|nr:hypothetical protein HYH03_011257 [Edaphochlamys debaryana]|eukprot:KAG2490306.1 hypothetical protein HYH03_011257 [Edaphochlamys debaryana]
MRNCNRPALLVTPGARGAIHIAGSVFTKFTRVLDRALDLDLKLVPFRDVPSQPTPISPTTMALVIHAPGFAGSLSITNTTFTANAFLGQSPAEEDPPGSDPDQPPPTALSGGGWTQPPPMGEADGPMFRSLLPSALSAAEAVLTARKHRSSRIPRGQGQALPVEGGSSPPGQEEGVPWPAAAGAAYYRAAAVPRLGLDDSAPPPLDPSFDSGTPSNDAANLRIRDPVILRNAKELHPGMKPGPWADDLEAVVAVTCASAAAGAACSVRLEGVRIVGNTGVATSGLYVMCDGANGMTCDVTLTDCTVQDNRLMWQPAVDVKRLPRLRYINGMFGYTSNFPSVFAAMMPWLTYTYPIIDYWQKGVFSEVGYDYATTMLPYLGKVTGRTLGAVVIHQRNSPWPGAVEGRPPMLRVNVTGAEFSGNDGAGFMSTATDWAELAGTPDNPANILRHGADITLEDVSLHDHTSGFPAVWVRWARNVRVTNCTATRTTGAVWLDEVRDEAVVEDSAFVGNPTSPQRYLFFNSFISVAPPREGMDYNVMGDGEDFQRFFAAGMTQLVLIKMSTLSGQRQANVANVRNCVFEENGSYISGTLYILGSEAPSGFKAKDLRTSTDVNVVNTHFIRNYCWALPWRQENASKCSTGERPLLISSVANAVIRGCRFIGNRNGGLITEWIRSSSLVEDGVFEHNVNTYDIHEDYIAPYTGQGYGGGAFVARQIGDGPVQLESCSFTNNSSPSGGGAVFLTEVNLSEVVVANCNFTDNSAIYGDGGALWLWKSDTSTDDAFSTVNGCSITACNFSSNIAGRRGGAVSGNTNTAWTVRSCRFTNNTAMLSPGMSSIDPNTSPIRMYEALDMDSTGGGAIYAQGFVSVALMNCTLEGNKVARHAGGALRLTDGNYVSLESNTFSRNSAVMGGAVAASRVGGVTVISDTYDSNSAVDPWAWPDTSPVPDSPFYMVHPLGAIQPGYGGAIYLTGADALSLQRALHMTNNSALQGGAIAMLRSGISVVGSIDDDDLDGYGSNEAPFNLALPPAVAAQPGVPSPFGTSSPGVLPYRMLFAHNTALLGGAVYLRDVLNVTWALRNGYRVVLNGLTNATLVAQGWEVAYTNLTVSVTEYVPPGSRLIRSEPAILFFNNTANGGAGLYLDSTQNASLAHVRFVANTARSPPLAPGYSGLSGREGRSRTAAQQPCFEGSGGAVCLVGIECSVGQECYESRDPSSYVLRRCDFAANTAEVNGGALVVAAGRDCTTLAGCYRTVVDNCTVTGNKAVRGTGGGVFWEHEGIVEVASCRDDTRRTLQLLGSSPPPPTSPPMDPTASSTPTDSSPSFTLLMPSRKGPATAYASLAADKRAAVLRSLSGAAPSDSFTTAFVLLGPNGTLLLPSAAGYTSVPSTGAGSVLATGIGAAGSQPPSAAVAPSKAPSSVLVSDGNGTVYRFPLELLRVAGSDPADFNGSFPALQRSVTLVANDSAWQGLPHTQLPCAHWVNNTAAGAGDLGTTPYFLLVQPRTDFYSSNTELGLAVTVHDWLGGNATGEGPDVLVTTVASQVSGPTTIVAANGTALFSGLRMRARQGPHPITFEGRTAGSVQRRLQSSTVTVYVRPCIVNEFLSPGNQDECLRCKPGAYNFKPAGESCLPCPGSAQCGSPEEGSGFLVPTPGYWHVHPFSNQIYECPNSDSCSDRNRGAALAAMQVRIWKAIRGVQVNASTSALDTALAALSPPASGPKPGSGSPTLGHRLRHLRSLAQVAAAAPPPPAAATPPYNGTYDSQAVLTTLAAIIPDYVDGQCADGYTGTLCAECAPGWGWRDVATCVKCPARALSAFFYSLATLLTLLSLFITIEASLSAQDALMSKRGTRTAASRRSKLKLADRYPAAIVQEVPHKEGAAPTGWGGGQAAFPAAESGTPEVAVLTEPAEDQGAEGGQELALAPAVAPNPPMQGTDCHSSPQRAGAVLPLGGGGFSGLQTASAYSPVATPMPPPPPPPPVMPPPSPPPPLCPAGGGGGGKGAERSLPAKAATEPDFAPLGASRPSAPPSSGPLPPSQPPPHHSISLPVGSASATDGHLPLASATIPGGYNLNPTLMAGPQHTGPPRQQQPGLTGGLGPPRPYSLQRHSSEQGAAGEARPSGHGGAAQSGPDGGGQDQAGPNRIGRASWGDDRLSEASDGTARLGSGAAGGGGGAGRQEPNAIASDRVDEGSGDMGIPDLATIIRIFIAYLQVLSLLRHVDMELPSLLLLIQSISSQATSYTGMLVSLECALPPTDSTNSAIIRLAITVLAPAYTLAATALFFFAWNTAKYLCHRRPAAITAGTYASHLASCMRGQMMVALCAIMFFFYPSVCQALMSIFDCQEVSTRDDSLGFEGWETQLYWKQDFGVVCYEGAHNRLAYGLGIPVLVLFGLGWPMMSALIMTGKTFSCCRTGSRAKSRNQNSSLLPVDAPAMDYKKGWVWWESVVMLRQLAIAAVVTFVGAVGDSASGTVQLLVVLSILIAASVAQTVVQPYKFVHTDILALLSLYVLLLTVYIMLYLPFTPSDHAISVIVVVLNVLVSCLFVLHIVRTYWRGLLISSGLHEIDEAERKKWTYEQMRKHILHTMMQEAERGRTEKTDKLPNSMASCHSQNPSSRFLERVASLQLTSVASSKAAVIVLGTSVSRLLQLRPSTTGALKQEGAGGGAQEEERPKKEAVPPTWWGRFLAVLMGRTFETKLDEEGGKEGEVKGTAKAGGPGSGGGRKRLST